MKLTEKEFKLKKKLQRLVDFCIERNRLNYLKRHNHAPGRKLLIRVNYYQGDSISLYFGTHLFLLNTQKSDSVFINNTLFEIRDYDDDELFNLSTIHSNETITLLKLYCTLDLGKYVISIDTLDYQLICDASNSIDTQFVKFNREIYDY